MTKPTKLLCETNQQTENVNKTLSLQALLCPQKILSINHNILKFKKHKQSLNFTAQEQQVLTELQNALNVFEDETKLKIVKTVSCVIEAFNVPSIYARRIIKFCKSISAFKILKEPDQYIILKNFYLKILMLRISFMWDVEKNGYPIIQVK